MLRRALWTLFLAVLVAVPTAYVLRNHLFLDSSGGPPFLRADIAEVRAKQQPLLTQAFKEKGLAFGAPVYLRIFKEEATLELWVQRPNGSYGLFRDYPICNFSGDLGPKLREGDRQSPEGFYTVTTAALNPNSAFHLSFNLGFPNALDRAHARTGSYLMVHGDCVSVGCYAMTDPAIEEIYVALEAALLSGQTSVPVHAFPFRITSERMQTETDHKWFDFWQSLQPAFDVFEANKILPVTSVHKGRYVVSMQ
ncbi:MAG: L,D-transpeptidase family protein [Shimia sp.]|uniref:L,D-transpeptidase family protein n=1 Tax=Shimia sp. TaxID=1954381 RepID=UPI0040588634